MTGPGPGPIARAWASYREVVVPVDAPPVQVQESQRAFYAGAVALYYAVMGSVSVGEEVTDADTQLMETIARELETFAARVGRDA